jgi:hypothetical protein
MPILAFSRVPGQVDDNVDGQFAKQCRNLPV